MSLLSSNSSGIYNIPISISSLKKIGFTPKERVTSWPMQKVTYSFIKDNIQVTLINTLSTTLDKDYAYKIIISKEDDELIRCKELAIDTIGELLEAINSI